MKHRFARLTSSTSRRIGFALFAKNQRNRNDFPVRGFAFPIIWINPVKCRTRWNNSKSSICIPYSAWVPPLMSSLRAKRPPRPASRAASFCGVSLQSAPAIILSIPVAYLPQRDSVMWFNKLFISCVAARASSQKARSSIRIYIYRKPAISN